MTKGYRPIYSDRSCFGHGRSVIASRAKSYPSPNPRRSMVRLRFWMAKWFPVHGRNPFWKPVAYPQHTNQHEKTSSFHLFQIPFPTFAWQAQQLWCLQAIGTAALPAVKRTDGCGRNFQARCRFRSSSWRCSHGLTSTMHTCRSWSAGTSSTAPKPLLLLPFKVGCGWTLRMIGLKCHASFPKTL